MKDSGEEEEPNRMVSDCSDLLILYGLTMLDN